MRLIAVFIHEMSHAIACWVSGGHVHEIKVWDNEGGVTRYIGGCRCLIIPAGYVGCAIWAMIFVILSGGRKTATAAAVGFILSLVTALCCSPNRMLVCLNLAYAILTSAFVWIEWFYYTPILQFLILFYGVSIGMFAIADIYEDTILRSVRQSDAYACSTEVCRCCPPRAVGVQWALLAIALQLFGIWVALVEMSDECEDKGWFQCINLSVEWQGGFDLWERNWDFDGFWEP